MSTEMKELVEWALAEARKAGAGSVRVSLSQDRSVEIEYRERKADKLKESSSRSLGIESFVDGRYSSQTTSDLRREALAAFIRNAVASTRLLAEDPYRSLPDPKLYEGRSEADLGIRDPGYDKITPEQRHGAVKAVEAACLDEGGSKVVSVTAVTQDNLSERVVMTSNGFAGEERETGYTLGATMTAQDEGDRRPAAYHFLSARTREGLPDAANVGRGAARRTLDLLGARKIPTQTLPVIIENRGVGRVLSGLVGPMSAGRIQQKRSFLADKKGAKIASDKLTLIDDPLFVGGLSSRHFDEDGFPSRRRVMIDQGVLRDFYVDWYYGRKLGWEPTTGGSSNLLIPSGKRSVEAIMKDLGRGIVVTDFIGGNSNPTTGDASVGIVGYLFEGGAKSQPIAEMNVADNHLKLWQRLAEVADDPWPYGSWRTPSLVFTDVVVSGA